MGRSKACIFILFFALGGALYGWFRSAMPDYIRERIDDCFARRTCTIFASLYNRVCMQICEYTFTPFGRMRAVVMAKYMYIYYIRIQHKTL